MRELLDEFICKNFRVVLNADGIKELENAVELNKKRLKKDLSKRQKRFLLEIGDAKDLITEECSYESFVAGFELGLKLNNVEYLCFV